MGSWVYDHDGANQIAEAKDANGNLMQYQYDLGGRITAMNSSVTNQSLAYLYDESCALGGLSYQNSSGRPTTVQARDPNGNRIFTHYCYDFDGRITNQLEERGPDGSSTSSDIHYAWGANSELLGMTYPDGEQVTYDYPSAGGMVPVPRPSEVDVGYQGGQSVIASGVSYFSDGVVASLTYGNGSLRQLTRNKRGEWTHLVSGPAAGPVLDQAYQFDGNGMGLVTAVHWFENQYNAWDWTFGYDALNRLTNYTTNVTGTAQSWAWTYDEVGNRLSDSYNGGTPNAYTYDSSGATSRLASADGLGWEYDSAGNVTQQTPAGGAGRRTKSDWSARQPAARRPERHQGDSCGPRGASGPTRYVTCGRTTPWRSVESGLILPAGFRERLRQAQQPQRALDLPAEIPGRGGDVLDLRQAQEADRHVAQRRHRVRTPPAAHPGAILVVGHVSHVVEAILDLPVVAVVGE